MATYISIHDIASYSADTTRNKSDTGREYYAATLRFRDSKDELTEVTLFSDKNLNITDTYEDYHDEL